MKGDKRKTRRKQQHLKKMLNDLNLPVSVEAGETKNE